MWAADPLNLAGKPADDLTKMEYRAVTVSGKYDFENQVALRNRYYQNQYGYNLLTPLLLGDGSAVLVDRGWIPADGNDSPSSWSRYDQPGRVNLQGQIRLGQARPDIGGALDPTLAPGQSKLEFWNNVDLERIGHQLPYPLLDIYIQPEMDPTDETPPIPFQPELELSEGPHLGYAIQWFIFAGILILGYPFYVRKELSKPSEGFMEEK